MRSVVIPIIWMILLILVLPANTLLMKTSEQDQAAQKPLQQIDSVILTECPSAVELPLMLGRPAPCLATFSTIPH